MANPEHLAVMNEALGKKDIGIWNEWLKNHRKGDIAFYPDLADASLCEADLGEANLDGVNLCRADLQGAYLREATLIRAGLLESKLNNADLTAADLRASNLTKANLTHAFLVEVNFFNATLSGADLSGSLLFNTFFIGTVLDKANFSGAKFGNTSIDGIDLSSAEGLDKVEHVSPSMIGIDILYKSKGSIPDVFLRGCGVPEDMIAYARSLRGKVIYFYSCFISHSARDKLFCERLYADLQTKGVRVWYFPEDAKWGEPIWGEIDRSIKVYDKLVVVLSENSLQSGPVLREIERALNREDAEHKSVLFPITLDRYVFDTWQHERKADVTRKVVGDFSGWDKDAAKYDKAFDKLLKGLQAESGKA